MINICKHEKNTSPKSTYQFFIMMTLTTEALDRLVIRSQSQQWPRTSNFYYCLVFLLDPMTYYICFGVFLSKKYFHVKTVQIELFAVEIIISIHISYSKKICQNVKIERKNSWFYLLKVSFPGHFLLCTNRAHKCSWNFFMRTWGLFF